MIVTEPWVTNWLTPIWLIGVGVIVGMLLLLALWLVAWALSRVPVIGELAENTELRSKVATGLAIALMIPLAILLVLPQFSAERTEASTSLLEGVGISLTITVSLAVFGAISFVWLTSRRTVSEVVQAVSEGALWYIFVVICVLSGFTAVATLVVYTPQEILTSTLRLPFTGVVTANEVIPGTDFDALGDARDPEQIPVDVEFRADEIQQINVNSTERLTIDTESNVAVDLDPFLEVDPDVDLSWARPADGSNPFESEVVSALYVRNYGAGDAELELSYITAPPIPQVVIIPIVATVVVLVFLVYILQRSLMPKASAIALATTKSEVAQPLFLILVITGIVLLNSFLWLPYNTLGEDIKMLKDTGMTVIMILCIIQAVWAASNSISEEIDGRTALTVLSKPIGRRSFIAGKFMGIAWTVMVMFVLLSLFLLVIVAYKPIHEAREMSTGDVTWQQCFQEMADVIPGLALALMEALVLAALSVAISTRVAMLGNFVICFSIYVMGNLTPLLVQSSIGQFAPVEFVANLLATVLPILDHFNIQAAIAAGKDVPPVYLGWSLVYSLIYGAIALLLALVLFEDRDLA